MRQKARTLRSIAAALSVCGSLTAYGATPTEIQKEFASAVGSGGAFSGFSAQRGEQFFKSRHGNDWSCASCHTEWPAQAGRHAQTGKTIAALAPSANPQRFTDVAKVEKWFKRNCNDVLQRACTSQEKGDVMQYLLTVRVGQ